jgi:hypothetical protein
MAFFRIVTRANGKRYLYNEERYRQGGKVKSRSRSLGPVDGNARKPRRGGGSLLAFLHAQRLSPEDRALAVAEKAAARTEQYQREVFGETGPERAERERQQHLDKLHALYGLTLGPRNPTPIEPQPAPAAVDTEESPGETEPVAATAEAPK